MPETSVNPFDRRALRQALRKLESLSDLGRQPIRNLAVVRKRQQERHRDDSDAEYGLTVRELLRDAIVQMKPEVGQDTDLETWERWSILEQEYIEGRSPEYIYQVHLHFSRRTYFNRKRRALDSLALILMAWEDEARASRNPVPFQAGHVLRYFTGRKREIETIVKLADSGRSITIYGMPAVGKTELVVRASYELRDRFPDGVLWADVDAEEIMQILRRFAERYGKDISAYTTVESRSQVVRDLLAGKKVLIVLDSVGPDDEIGLLVPPIGSALTVVTTQHDPLSVPWSAEQIQLQPFNENGRDAIRLFEEIVGKERVEKEVAAFAEISKEAGYFPLAIDLIAHRLVHEPAWSASSFLKRLRQEKSPLNAIRFKDRSVSSALAASYKALKPELQDLFTALGVFSHTGFSVNAVAVVTQKAEQATEDNLRQLHGLSLIRGSHQHRYRMHVVLHNYAKDMIDDHRLYHRMVDYYVRYVNSYNRDYVALDLELTNILLALDIATKRELSSALINGSNALVGYFDVRGLHTLAQQQLERAEDAARRSRNISGLTHTLMSLGRVKRQLGNVDQAENVYREGLALAHDIKEHSLIAVAHLGLGALYGSKSDYEREEGHYLDALYYSRLVDDKERTCELLINLGVLRHERGEYDQAVKELTEARDLAETLGFKDLILDVCLNLGAVEASRGKYAIAETLLNTGLKLARDMNHRERIGYLLWNLGEVLAFIGRLVEGEVHLREALAITRELNNKTLLARVSWNLARVEVLTGKHSRAEQHLREGLILAEKLEQPWSIAGALIGFGELYIEKEQWNLAEQRFRRALEISSKNSIPEHQADSWFGLARVSSALGDDTAAEEYAKTSGRLFEEIKHRKADVIRRWISSLIE